MLSKYLLDKHRKTDNKIETLREYAEQNRTNC